MSFSVSKGCHDFFLSNIGLDIYFVFSANPGKTMLDLGFTLRVVNTSLGMSKRTVDSKREL
ncbi:hypothetical protein BpHYR1_044738 [Brachionus plicatilis]|uniref:Uncharacterized protein n=1 Tax=Brachionus plicatilis TaxID=10195 RepID=A0A3M7Q712_BRAPC|nr:hypothetical protein BpHYR1_044738 [Brachionus plicatilis]